MNQKLAVGRSLARTFVYVLFSLFLIPAGTYFFTLHVQKDEDERFRAAIAQQIDRDAEMTAAEKAERKQFFNAHPPSRICGDRDPQVQQVRGRLCDTFTEVWQFHWAKRMALGTMVGGVALMVTVLVLGWLAFADRALQYRSFVAGWRITTWASVLELLVQGTMAVWLSFWLTVFFSGTYYPKLIIVVGLAAAVAVFMAVAALLRKVQAENAVEGVLLKAEDAPVLWERIAHMAAKLKTAPPQQIVAGIDTNFFVTEAPLRVGNQTVTGRTLFVSIPLLRVLDQAQADAVFGHELAHLRGGDTESSARLGPKLVQFDHYCAALRSASVAALVAPLLTLYRGIFELALARDSREREFKADRIAARLISAQAIAHSLVKVAAYAQYRSHIEHQLFSHDRRHAAQLGIAQFIGEGLAPYARSDEFVDAMRTANVPHPFDSHPAMAERMKNVGVALRDEDLGGIVTRPAESSWVQFIHPADDIERALWARYEEAFAAEHERSLAYRYEPATDEERVIVLKYFPPVEFALKGVHTVEVSIDGIRTSADEQTVFWDAVKALQFKESSFGNALIVTHPEKGMLGTAKTTKVKLNGLTKEKDRFQEIVNHYWHRHQVMRAQQAS